MPIDRYDLIRFQRAYRDRKGPVNLKIKCLNKYFCHYLDAEWYVPMNLK